MIKVIYLEEVGFESVISTLKNLEQSIEIVNKKQRKGKAIPYYNIESGFDIETTSTYINGNKRAWLYEWTYGIKDTIIIGRTEDDLRDLFTILKAIFNRGNLVIYVHNLEFEFQFIRKWFKDLEVFSADQRAVMKATTGNLEFRDSYVLSDLSLAKLAENLVSHKIEKLKGDLDYSVIRYSDTPMTAQEYQYCINDVVIILYYINEQMEEFGNILKIPMTNTGRVRNYCRENCLYKTNYTGRRVLNWNYKKQLEDEVLTPDLYLQSKSAFGGGFVHSSLLWTNLTLKKVGSYDLSSAYVGMALLYGYPSGEPYQFNNMSLEEYNKVRVEHCLLFRASFKGLRLKKEINDCYISYKPKKQVASGLMLHNGRIREAESLEIDLIDTDLEIILKAYEFDSLEILNGYIWKKELLPKELVECMLHFYEGKTTLKGVADKKQEYQRLKGMLNSTYGMMVQDPMKDEAIYEDEQWSSQPAPLDNLTKYNSSFSRFLYYPQGLWITGYCRRTIWNAIFAVGDDYVYSDTDSVKILNPEKHKRYFEDYNNSVRTQLATNLKRLGLDPNRAEPKTIKGEKKLLGAFDFEGIYDEFKTLGAKRYLVREGEEYELTCAGVAKSAVDYIVSKGGFEAFKLDLTVPKEYTGKLTHTYLDEQFIDRSEDHIVYACSAIHLEPAEYSMNPDEEWLQQLLNYRTIKGLIK